MQCSVIQCNVICIFKNKFIKLKNCIIFCEKHKYVCIECLTRKWLFIFWFAWAAYLNPTIATRAAVSSHVLYFACLRFSLFYFHGNSALSPLSSSIYVGRVLIKLSNNPARRVPLLSRDWCSTSWLIKYSRSHASPNALSSGYGQCWCKTADRTLDVNES